MLLQPNAKVRNGRQNMLGALIFKIAIDGRSHIGDSNATINTNKYKEGETKRNETIHKSPFKCAHMKIFN